MKPLIVDASGRPVRAERKPAPNNNCPQCGAGPNKRVASSGFGQTPHPICTCGYEWKDEVFHG